MDPRQQAQDYSGGNPQRVGNNYGFNGIQNDPFNAFVNTDNDSAFESSWTNPSLPAQQPQINGFDQASHSWQQQNPYQSSNFLGTASYGPPREYEQPYSRSPSSFNYPSFDPSHNQTFAPNTYDNASHPYEDPLYGSLSNGAQFEYTGPAGVRQHHDTISPQALQTYPSAFNHSTADGNPQSHQAHYGTNLPVRRASATGPALHTGPDWVSLASATSESLSARGLHIKPTGGLSSATKSSRIDGFVFVGNGKQISGPIKVKVPRNDRKRSLKTIRRIFEIEKGNEALSQERGHLMKKLKLTESKLGSRPPKSAAHSRSGSTAESESLSESSDSESDDDSAYYTESDVEIQPEEPSPVPASRPADPNKAVEYDVIKAVWAKKSVGLSSTVIRTALGEYWNIFKGIRDKWKAKATTLQQAVEKKDQANIKAYERRVIDQRRLLESCIRLTLKHGHPDIIEKLGENPAFLLVFYQFLADRFKDSEYTSSLITSILELMNRCVTIDQEMLEKTKLDKVLPRLLKRGDDQGKVFAKKILDNAADLSKQKTADGTSGQRRLPNGELHKSSNDTKDIKRELSDDSKKTLSLNTKGSNATKIAKSASGSDTRQSPAKVEAKSSTKISGVDASTAKIKTNHITAKPNGFFAGLKSASKKPGTSAKSEELKTNVPAEPKAEPAPAPKSGFSFAATMAALETQKEAPPIKVQETRKPETPEEKRKRLRKEERRKLRVSFKADDDLVQVREFVHDPEEELGHEDSQVRDVKDTRGEGQMLKMHKDLDLEEDEDYEPPDEIILPEWTTPQPIDFSVVGEQELARNYTSRGGKIEIRSEERAVQEQRELSTLMVVYTNDSDIPASPREPTNTFSGEPAKEESFGAPTEETKNREAAVNARRNPTSAVNPPMPDIANLLRIMQGQNQAQAQPPPPPQPPQPAAAPTALEAIFAQFNNSNPQQAPVVQQAVQQPAPTFDLGAALAGISPPVQQQTGFGAPPQPQVNIQAILAQMGNQSGSQAPHMPGYGYGNPTPNENDRKRQHDQDDGDYGRKRARGGPGSDKLPYKVKVCKYWKEGKCRWGDGCSYLHE